MQKILIIEDDPMIRDELALLLSNEGYQTAIVTEFTNVAVQVLEHDPNLILLDLNLPERDGLSLCADIRKASPRIGKQLWRPCVARAALFQNREGMSI